MDQGGVQKEFFQAVSDTLVDPSYHMFTYNTETRISWFDAHSLEPVSSFEFAGVVSAWAVIFFCCCFCFFVFP